MLEQFLKEELAGKYDVGWRYDFQTNSIVTEMSDGLLKVTHSIPMDALVYNIRSNLSDYMEHVLRNMMRQIDNYRANERERLRRNASATGEALLRESIF